MNIGISNNSRKSKTNSRYPFIVFCLLIFFTSTLLAGCSAPQLTGSNDINDLSRLSISEVTENELSISDNQSLDSTILEEANLASVEQAAEPVKTEVTEELQTSSQSSASDLAAAAPEITPQAEPQPTAADVEAQPATLPQAEPKIGFLAPDITLTSLDGTPLKLSDLRGKNIVINYWVTWCVPCQEELPALDRISQEYQDNNLVVISVNGITQDQIDAVHQMVGDMGLTQTIVLDENESFWQSYLVQFLPTSFFIDNQGIIRHILLGSTTEDNFRAKVDQLIAGQL